MEIIKHGNTVKTAICGNCSCTFNFAKTEMNTQIIQNPFGYEYKSITYINCPECGKEIEIQEAITYGQLQQF